ncbi:MAG: CDP-alcohol phosphatidyltransferase family protein [Fidelibacterota bacterium]|nr:MAG: CDP-alcohol phosphatidyltransferase family protein [Candidatus Neomarinimicrobiota bacterium]
MKRTSDRIVTVSNALSLFRAFLSIPLVWALEVDHLQAVLVMILLAVLSDFFDGYLARRAHTITDVGKMLDPIADKIIMLSVMIFLIFDPERQFPIFFFVLLGIRDITLSNIATYLMNRSSVVFQSNLTGKWFSSATALAMILYVLKLTDIGFWVLMIATLLLLISWYSYFRRYLEYFRDLSEI